MAYLFVIKDGPKYFLAHNTSGDPRLGYQVIKQGLTVDSATKLAEKLLRTNDSIVKLNKNGTWPNIIYEKLDMVTIKKSRVKKI